MSLHRLRQNITVPTIELTLKTSKPLIFDESVGLRGFIGRYFQENILMHNHDDNSFIYSYPRVQYKVIEPKIIIIGLAEGFDAVKELRLLENIIIGSENILVECVNFTENESIFGISAIKYPYSFLTPWLALNERNYGQYQKLGGWEKKKEFLEKILIGNIISMSKGIGYTVPEPIKANIINLKEINTSLKGNPMLGFLGSFSVNFEIPDYWGIGKSVSRGFGTVVRQKTDGRR
jgi:hypothetical protein